MSTGLAVKPIGMEPEAELFLEDFDDSGVPSVPALQRADSLNVREQAAIRDSFDELADELEESSAALGSTRAATTDPAFVEILALGQAVIPAVVDRLKVSSNRPLWMRVLGTFTSLPPGFGQDTIEGSAAAWDAWWRGRSF